MFNLRSWASFLLLPFAAKSCDVLLTDTEEKKRRGRDGGLSSADKESDIAQRPEGIALDALHLFSICPSLPRPYKWLYPPTLQTGCPGWDQVGFAAEPRVSRRSLHLSGGFASPLATWGSTCSLVHTDMRRVQLKACICVRGLDAVNTTDLL